LGSGTHDDYLRLDDHGPFNDYWPLDHYWPLHDYSGWLSGIDRTRCWPGDHASCETQKD
jgi:hypothetical protein